VIVSPHFRIRRSGSSPGFTLIEVLVVIAIIALLSAILLPVLFRAREGGHRAACLSNMRQIAVAFLMYADDYDEGFPNTDDPYLWMGRRWRWPVQPYLAMAGVRDPSSPGDPNSSVGFRPAILLCPSDRIAPATWDSTSYAYCAAFYHTPAQVNSMTTADLYAGSPPPCVTISLAEVAFPARKIMLGEWLTNHVPGIQDGWWSWRGARNYAFVDGHAKYVQAQSISPAVNGFPDPNLTVDGVAGADLP
jgi:prepilin-type N-terminal cleavage/methylation domain-containing protein/prepilin-type processing-associated H-X9-DG protein